MSNGWEFDIQAVGKKIGELEAGISEGKGEIAKSHSHLSGPLVTKCETLLSQLKEDIAEFSGRSLGLSPPFKPELIERLVICRKVWECGTFLAALSGNVSEFERSMKNLRTSYYRDYAEHLPPSGDECEIVGLYLLYLLSTNRLGEFHIAVEIIPVHVKAHECVRYTLDLEVCLMDGNHNKVVSAASKFPRPVYCCFIGRLVDTARSKVSYCLQSSYRSVSLAHAAKLLMLPCTNTGEVEVAVKKYAEQMNERNLTECQSVGEDDIRRDDESAVWTRWDVNDHSLVFTPIHCGVGERGAISSSASAQRQSSSVWGGGGVSHENIRAMEVIQNVIEYATEMERIV